MESKNQSIYKKDLGLKGDITITLNADERMMIAEALAKCASQETNIIPLMLLANRIVTGK